jgi:hypothetical protein
VAELYLHQGVRDLAWLITSPDLFDPAVSGLVLPPRPWRDQLIARSLPWLDQIDDNPKDLQAWLGEDWVDSKQGARLGSHAERLIEFWLTSQPGIDVRAARLTVHSDERVLGDLDIVFSDERRPGWVHWEIAVKFYLRHEQALGHGSASTRNKSKVPEISQNIAKRCEISATGWKQWIGPNPRDRLDEKLERIVSHQLPLGASPETRRALRGIGDLPIVSEAWVKGWMFHPIEETSEATVPGLAPDHLRGWWFRHKEAEVPVKSRSSRFVIVPRWEWMAPVHRPNAGDQSLLAARQLNERLHSHFARSPAPVLIAEVQLDLHGWWKELGRGFVVHPDWPSLAELHPSNQD